MTMQQLSLFDEPRYTGSQHDELARAAADAFEHAHGVPVRPGVNVHMQGEMPQCGIPACNTDAFITIPVGTRWGVHLCLECWDALTD